MKITFLMKININCMKFEFGATFNLLSKNFEGKIELKYDLNWYESQIFINKVFKCEFLYL